MGLNNFILTCEKNNKELRKEIEYYKRYNKRLQQEKQQVKNNWNELKKWLEFMIMQQREGKTVYISLNDILNKLQELEGNNE